MDRDRARILMEAALEPLRDPSLRPADPRFEAFADEAADVPGDLMGSTCVEEGAALLPRRERRRLAESFAARRPELWRRLVRSGRGWDGAEAVVVEAAVAAAIGDRRPCSPEGLAEIEQAGDIHPGNALVAVIPPTSIWSLDDAAAAQARVAEAGNPEAAVARIAFERLSFAHEDRIRARVDLIARRLPAPGFPRASDVLARGCSWVATEPQVAAEVAAAVLDAYVRILSEGVLFFLAETERDGAL